MLFSSVTFLFYFLPLTVALYYIVPKPAKNIILLIASLIFYAWGEPVYVILMILSILLNYFLGRAIEEKGAYPALKKRTLIIAVAANLAILGFFKYYGFFLDSINAVLPFHIPYRQLALPIGISFYTFQAMSYIIDVYREDAPAQRSILSFALYISMFPQLIAGPIVRYTDIDEQLRNRKHSAAKFGAGARYFIIGLAKKVLLANGIGALFTLVQADVLAGRAAVLTAWLGAAAYTLQIYFDFSGYSDMAIGLGKMFGFELKQNFDYPYTANSVTDFWRRWHISLSTWFREYVYIPLGGNRVSVGRHILNLLIVWTLTGFWHGAAWNFLFWGLYYGILLIIEKYLLDPVLEKLPGVVRHIYTLLIVVIGWVFFFSDSLKDAFSYLGTMFGAGAAGFAAKGSFFLLTSHWLLWIACIIASTRLLAGVSEKARGARRWILTAGYVILFFLSVSALITDTFNPFLYFRF